MAGRIAPADDRDLIEVDEQQLAALIAKVVAAHIGMMTREALNTALGRLD
jgi:hypothetical protein